MCNRNMNWNQRLQNVPKRSKITYYVHLNDYLSKDWGKNFKIKKYSFAEVFSYSFVHNSVSITALFYIISKYTQNFKVSDVCWSWRVNYVWLCYWCIKWQQKIMNG